jgi:dihydrodipicolinate synthase/N-acetylneuraminate lyase
MVKGALTAIVTPFREGEVDQQALCELVESRSKAASTAWCRATRPGR